MPYTPHTLRPTMPWWESVARESVVTPTGLETCALTFGKRTHAPHAYTNHASPIQSNPHTSASPNHGVLHTVLHPTMGSFTRGQHSWGSLTMFTSAPPMTSQKDSKI